MWSGFGIWLGFRLSTHPSTPSSCGLTAGSRKSPLDCGQAAGREAGEARGAASAFGSAFDSRHTPPLRRPAA